MNAGERRAVTHPAPRRESRCTSEQALPGPILDLGTCYSPGRWAEPVSVGMLKYAGSQMKGHGGTGHSSGVRTRGWVVG